MPFVGRPEYDFSRRIRTGRPHQSCHPAIPNWTEQAIQCEQHESDTKETKQPDGMPTLLPEDTVHVIKKSQLVLSSGGLHVVADIFKCYSHSFEWNFDGS